MATKKTALTIEQILSGTAFARPQSVGHMDVIPLVPDAGSSVDDTFAPPTVNASTRGYGHVAMVNENPDKPTIVPTGSGWVTPQAAQDHAIASAEFLPPKGTKEVDTAMCIQRSQGGFIRDAKELLILPVTLRTAALSMRKDSDFRKLWPAIDAFNKSLGVRDTGGHLVYFLEHFRKQLDEFVAEFELVPNQIGAVILVGGHIVGVERAPNPDFWSALWEPLVRVCYGAVAMHARKVFGDKPAPNRKPLDVKVKSLAGIAAALAETKTASQASFDKALADVKMATLLTNGQERKFGDYSLLTVANQRLAGQLVEHADGRVPYLSLGIADMK